jgi:hypothetical protein
MYPGWLHVYASGFVITVTEFAAEATAGRAMTDAAAIATAATIAANVGGRLNAARNDFFMLPPVNFIHVTERNRHADPARMTQISNIESTAPAASTPSGKAPDIWGYRGGYPFFQDGALGRPCPENERVA